MIKFSFLFFLLFKLILLLFSLQQEQSICFEKQIYNRKHEVRHQHHHEYGHSIGSPTLEEEHHENHEERAQERR